jgi:2-succinyl-5-enolpyruvyl-6-hydroxy-3-cyclohexene-1-carboxylate synthase
MRPFLYLIQMAVVQPLVDIAAVCYAHGIRNVVISPGSRSAALTLAFTRHGGFKSLPVMDERAAGFIALGMAQQTRVPVVLICTSGSAAYNYAPAVSEAFFQQIPLLVLTADRPKEWLHQHDGQTIYQAEIYGKHVKGSFELPSDYGHKDAQWLINRTINEAILLAGTASSGPVHINVPVREPFYPTDTEALVPTQGVRIINRVRVETMLAPTVWHELLDSWDSAERILIVGGQHGNSAKLNHFLNLLAEEFDVPILGDTISNQKGSKNFITHHDLFLPTAQVEQLRPDLLITYGLSLVSKALKQFLRNNRAVEHWHISEDRHVVDPFQSLTRQIPVSPVYFFENIFEKFDYEQFVQGTVPSTDASYLSLLSAYERKAGILLDAYLKNLTTLNDLSAIDTVVMSLSGSYRLQVANSMPVRYLNALGRRIGEAVVFANRGTSGIDGCVSTAIGAALEAESPTVLLVGDVAFLYDRNGLLINPLPENLKIVVINNAGGNIFRMIDGPSKLPELEGYFETTHQYTAERTAGDSGIAYFSVVNMVELHQTVPQFLSASGTVILEVFTDPAENARVWSGLKEYVKANG